MILQNARFWICQFGSTYCCEQAFSVMKLNKSQARAQLTDEHLDAIMTVAISPLQPNLQNLVDRKRLQSSGFIE